MGIIARKLTELSSEGVKTGALMVGATHVKTQRTASGMGLKGARDRRIGRTMSGLNSKLHTFRDIAGRPGRLFLSTGTIKTSSRVTKWSIEHAK